MLDIFLVSLVLIWATTAVIANGKRLRERDSKIFWSEKWKDEVRAHLESALDFQARDQGLVEVVESYEMDQLQSDETIDKLNQTVVDREATIAYLEKTVENMTDSIMILFGEVERH